jgi:hypothetical protein
MLPVPRLYFLSEIAPLNRKGISPTSRRDQSTGPDRGTHEMWAMRPQDVKKTVNAVSMRDIWVKTPRL